jgi:hypothetical protein
MLMMQVIRQLLSDFTRSSFPFRTEQQHRQQLREVKRQKTEKKRSDMAAQYGIHQSPCGLWGWRFPKELSCNDAFVYEGACSRGVQ